MNPVKIEFERTGYDPSIDYVKGLCILFVIWTHCMTREELRLILFPFWGDAAVQIFLTIQVFHFFKRDSFAHIPNLQKIWRRIIMPYIVLIVITFLLDYLIYYHDTNGIFDIQLYWDLRGPGSYYIFIYLQFAFLLPVIAPLFRYLSLNWLLILSIFVSQVVEYVCSVSDCPDNIYRITFFRYSFLIYLGYILATKGLTIDKKTIPLIFLSSVFIYVLCYTTYDMRPIFCTNLVLWPLCHWVCYFFIVYFIIWIMKLTYMKCSQKQTGSQFTYLIKQIGKYSYEIYLFQIFYYSIISIYVSKATSTIGIHSFERALYIIISTILCTLPVIIYKYLTKPSSK